MEERRELERFKLRLPARIEVVSGVPEVGRDLISPKISEVKKQR